VILCEKENILGGDLNIASVIPNKSRICLYQKFMEDELKRLNVEIRTECEVTPEIIKAENPDVVLIATGTRKKNS
jgi:NAD(H)-dependent 7beta-hydroxy-3-oxo-delta4-cholenoic acid oxidoreductase